MDKITANGEPEVPTIMFFHRSQHHQFEKRDQLFGTDMGTIDLPPGKGGFASLLTITGGTGSMSGAKGQIRLRGELNATEGTTGGGYLGELCSTE